MMKITSFRPGVIGNQSAFECMALIYKYLQDCHGFEFTMVKSEDDEYADPAFRIISIPPKLWKPIPKTPFFAPSVSRHKRLAALFEPADIILTLDPTLYFQGLPAIRVGSRMGIPVWVDASMTILGKGKSPAWKLLRPFMRKAFEQVTGIIVTVPKCIERFEDLRVWDAAAAGRCTVMGHPADTRMFKPLPKKSDRDGLLRVMVVSRLVPEKGLDYVLEAMAPVLNETGNLRLQIVGDGPMKGPLKKEIDERGLSGKVEFIDPVSHRELPRILGGADIYISHAVPTPRWEEYFGAANIEAMACGLPCILTKCGGVPYVVREPGTAVLISPRDIVALRTAVLQLISDAEKRTRMGVRARAYVQEHYSVPVLADKYHAMLLAGTTRSS